MFIGVALLVAFGFKNWVCAWVANRMGPRFKSAASVLVAMFRTDVLSGATVAFSSGRSKRPHFPKRCPFCKGSEHVTPPAVLALPSLDWTVRVFPNAFPIVSGTDGRHEVIVETDRHGALWEDLPPRQLHRIFEAYQDRFRALSARKNATYVLLFKNFGAKSGASIAHEHSQIVGFPFVPDAVASEVKNAGVLETWAKKEKVVVENVFFKAICPPASRFPYEVCVLCKDGKARFEDFTSEQGAALLSLLQVVIRKVKTAQGAPDYTLVFHAAPPGKKMRFHAEVLPRKAVWGGIELGSGVLVNYKSSSDALRELQEV